MFKQILKFKFKESNDFRALDVFSSYIYIYICLYAYITTGIPSLRWFTTVIGPVSNGHQTHQQQMELQLPVNGAISGYETMDKVCK